MTVATTGLAGRACSVKALTVIPEIVPTGSRVSRLELVARDHAGADLRSRG